jgi:hypothetical protein
MRTGDPLSCCSFSPQAKDKQHESDAWRGRQLRRSPLLSYRHSRWPAAAAGRPQPGWVALKRRCCERHCEFATTVSRIAGALAALTLLSLIARRCCLAFRNGPSLLPSHVPNRQVLEWESANSITIEADIPHRESALFSCLRRRRT